jgi:hypothetical protein
VWCAAHCHQHHRHLANDDDINSHIQVNTPDSGAGQPPGLTTPDNDVEEVGPGADEPLPSWHHHSTCPHIHHPLTPCALVRGMLTPTTPQATPVSLPKPEMTAPTTSFSYQALPLLLLPPPSATIAQPLTCMPTPAAAAAFSYEALPPPPVSTLTYSYQAPPPSQPLTALTYSYLPPPPQLPPAQQLWTRPTAPTAPLPPPPSARLAWPVTHALIPPLPQHSANDASMFPCSSVKEQPVPDDSTSQGIQPLSAPPTRAPSIPRQHDPAHAG